MADVLTLDQFAKQMDHAARKLNSEIRADLRKAGKAAADDMRALIAPYSKKIPVTIRVNTAGNFSVMITIGGPGIPETILLEFGNKGGEAKATFRHPVFAPAGTHGARVRDDGTPILWVEQPKHPYVLPVVVMRGPWVAEIMQGSLAKAFQPSV